jgi:hypothetical protein
VKSEDGSSARPPFGCAFAAATTFSTVNPNSCCSAFSGADAPNVCMPITRPVGPT